MFAEKREEREGRRGKGKEEGEIEKEDGKREGLPLILICNTSALSKERYSGHTRARGSTQASARPRLPAEGFWGPMSGQFEIRFGLSCYRTRAICMCQICYTDVDETSFCCCLNEPRCNGQIHFWFPAWFGLGKGHVRA